MTNPLLPRMPAQPATKLVIFAPYPPAKSGIADYVAELMPYHRAEFDVTLVIADDAPIPNEVGPRVLLASEFEKHRAFFSSALKLYHIGNNPHHCYMPDFLARDPGVVVLHDFNLCYMHEMATLKWGNAQRHLSAMAREYGLLGRDILDWQLRNGYRELFAGYELPLNGNVLEQATGIITHSRQVQYRVAARVPHKPVWCVPHHLSPQAIEYFTLSRQEARTQLGLPQNEIIVTAVGFVTRAKQIPMTLAALSSLREQAGRFRFVLAGERRPDEYDVDSDIANSGLSGLVTCTDYLDEGQFFKHLVASDIVVNLRYPSGGEMSGTLVRALGLGLPTIVLDHGPMGEMPDSIVKKVAWGDNTQAELTETLRELMTNNAARLELGSRAATYIRQEHDIAAVSARYNNILRNSPAAAKQTAAATKLHFQNPVSSARKLRHMDGRRQTLAQETDGRMWWTVPAIPLGDDDSHAALVVSVGCTKTSALLSHIFGWKSDAIAAMTPDDFLASRVRGPNDTPVPAGHFTFALVIVPARMPESSAALLMRRLNFAMRLGGCVCVETWAEESSGDNPDGPLLGQSQLSRRMRDAGFSSTREWSPQDGLIPELACGQSDLENSDQYTCISARKESDYAVWRFADSPDGLPQRFGGRLGVGGDL